VDQFTKIIRLKATTTNVLLEEIAKIYRDNIWKIHRVSKKILSDREPQFVSWFTEDLCKVLRVKRILFIVYKQIEKINQDIETFL